MKWTSPGRRELRLLLGNITTVAADAIAAAANSALAGGVRGHLARDAGSLQEVTFVLFDQAAFDGFAGVLTGL